MTNSSEDDPREARDSRFVTTRWSLVLSVADQDESKSQQALADLCQTYWYPIYAYMRRRTRDVHEAQDWTQAFFEQLLERQWIVNADPECGRFRAFLLTACRRFQINEWHKARAKKRGGGQRKLSLDFESGESKYADASVDSLTPDKLFEQQWAITLLARVLHRLREAWVSRGKLAHFEQLKQFLLGGDGTDRYADVASSLGTSEGAVKVAVHRMRGDYRGFLREEIAQTVDSVEDIDDEVRNLFLLLG